MTFLIIFAIILLLIIVASYYYLFARPDTPIGGSGDRSLTVGNVELRINITGYSITKTGSITVSGVPIGANPFATIVGRPVLIATKSLGVIHTTIVKDYTASPSNISFNTADGILPSTTKKVLQKDDFAIIY